MHHFKKLSIFSQLQFDRKGQKLPCKVFQHDFKQLNPKGPALEKHSFLVTDYINLIHKEYENRLSKKNIHLHFKLDSQLKINNDPTILVEILKTLLDNSLAHGFENKNGGNINIHASIQKDEFILRYLDDGEGIDESRMNLIFEPFNSKGPGANGHGLGLSIVYNLVHFVLSGSIDIQDAPEQGLSFVIRWPLVYN